MPYYHTHHRRCRWVTAVFDALEHNIVEQLSPTPIVANNYAVWAITRDFVLCVVTWLVSSFLTNHSWLHRFKGGITGRPRFYNLNVLVSCKSSTHQFWNQDVKRRYSSSSKICSKIHSLWVTLLKYWDSSRSRVPKNDVRYYHRY